MTRVPPAARSLTALRLVALASLITGAFAAGSDASFDELLVPGVFKKLARADVAAVVAASDPALGLSVDDACAFFASAAKGWVPLLRAMAWVMSDEVATTKLAVIAASVEHSPGNSSGVHLVVSVDAAAEGVSAQAVRDYVLKHLPNLEETAITVASQQQAQWAVHKPGGEPYASDALLSAVPSWRLGPRVHSQTVSKCWERRKGAHTH